VTGKTLRDTLAAGGVIASLVFVGMEIRQSNAQARAAAYQAIGTATAEVFNTSSHDREFSAILLKDPSDREPVEWQMLAAKSSAFARLGEMILLQIDQGVLGEDAIDRLGYGSWRTFLDQPEACVWPLIRPNVSAALRLLVAEGRDLEELDCSAYTLPRPQPGAS
jgi:hypothetical protein